MPAFLRSAVFTLCFLAVCHLAAEGQATKGIIAGRVTDSSGAVLPGAQITLPVAAVSTVSDSIGEFRFIGMLPGSYKLTVSFVGFESFSTDVTLQAGQVARVNAVLKVASKNEEIMVTADRPHGEAEAINLQRTSDNILDVLPSDVIRSLPNANVADAVGRLPGVTLERDEGEGKYVQVRGTEPRLNNVTVDGVEVPASEDNVRQVKLDTIPSGIVEAVEVNKTLSASQDADAIGGTVNLRTKTAGDLPTVTVEALGGFTPIVNTRYVGEVTTTVGERFGARKRFGALFSGSYDYNGRGIDDIEPQPDLNFGTPIYDSMDLREYRYKRYRYGFAGSLDYKLEEGSGLYLHYFDSDFRDYGDKWVYSLNDDVSVGPNGKPVITPDVPQFSNDDRLPDYGIASLAVGGKHVFTNSWLSWEISAARSRQLAAAGNPGATFSYGGAATCAYSPALTTNYHEPQWDPACLASGTQIYNPNQYYLTEFDSTSGETSQVNLQGAMSMARNYHLGGHSSTFEFGFKIRNAHKGQDAYSGTYDNVGNYGNTGNPPPMSMFLSGFTNPNYYLGVYNYGPVTNYDKITAFFRANPQLFPLDVPATIFNSDASNFDLTERVSAAYAMNTIEFGRFRLQTGFRFEATQLNILGYLVTNNTDAQGNTVDTVTPQPATNWYWDPLPSVQLRYALTPDSDIRAVYGRGISRPNPYDLVPYVTLDNTTNPITVAVGNPNLKPEHANDYDLLYEHYLKPFGLVQGGFFFKQLSDPIYYINNPLVPAGQPYAGKQLASIINGTTAWLCGIEFAYIQHLGFLPGPLSGVGLSANFSWTASNAGHLPERPDTPALQRQAPTTWNFSPTYDRGRFSGRLGLTYTSASIFQYQYTTANDTANLGTRGPAGDNYLYPHSQLDAQVSFRMTKSLSALWQGLNLTDEVFGFYNGSPVFVVQREYYRPTYTFGLRWEPRREY